jgi:amino acid adenylation domain-containing protein
MNRPNIRQMFERAAELYSEHPAIAGADRYLNYGELEDRSNSLANFLVESGISAGSVVPILAEDPFLIILGILGALKAGCIFAPLDCRIPNQVLESYLSLIAPQWILTEPALFGRLSMVLPNDDVRIRIISPAVTKRTSLIGNALPRTSRGLELLTEYDTYWNPARPENSFEPDDACCLYFTSGSSGAPKLITGRLRGIDHFVRWEIDTLGIGHGTNVSHLLPFCFDGSLRDIFVALSAGGTVRVRDHKDTVLDGSRLARWIGDAEINVLHCTPSLFRWLICEELSADSFPSLRHILLSGEPMLPPDLKAWFEIFGDRIKIVNLYGTAETTMAKFFYFVKPEDIQRRVIPIGKPMPGARAMVVDDTLSPCPAGTVGEILIRTPYRSLGYFRRRELTDAVFIQNPFSNDGSDIVHQTGDLGRVLADGNFEYVGRKDREVKIGGVRIETAEIDGVLRCHKSITDTAVVAVGEGGGKFLAAYFVARKNVETETLRTFLLEYLPENMVPSVFMQLAELPRLLSGKMDTAALPAIDKRRTVSDLNFECPMTPI